MISRLIVAITVALLAGIAAFLAWGNEFLCIEDDLPSEPVELAVVLAGPAEEDRERVKLAADLVQAEEARLLLLPLRHRALEWSWFVRHYHIKAHLPEDRVIIGRAENIKPGALIGLGGTFAEAQKTVAVMRERRLHSAVVVSSAYHMRRARLAFVRAGEGSGLVFYFHSADIGVPEDPEFWWLNGSYLVRVADEYVKLAGGYLFYK